MKKVKLHLGCGDVYLKGYTNIDIVGELASERPDLVKRCQTTLDKYYKHPFGENEGNDVVDIREDARLLPSFSAASVDEILCINLIDHFSKDDVLSALVRWKNILKPGGQLIIDVDDRSLQAQMLVDAKTIEETEYALFLLYRTHLEERERHRWGYTPPYLRAILEASGFIWVWSQRDYIRHDRHPGRQFTTLCYKP